MNALVFSNDWHGTEISYLIPISMSHTVPHILQTWSSSASTENSWKLAELVKLAMWTEQRMNFNSPITLTWDWPSVWGKRSSLSLIPWSQHLSLGWPFPSPPPSLRAPLAGCKDAAHTNKTGQGFYTKPVPFMNAYANSMIALTFLMKRFTAKAFTSL